MSERFKNPPLVELAAELRWAAGGVVGIHQQAGQIVMIPPPQYEEFFMLFGLKVRTLGYDRIERINPQGFLTLPFQPTYHFRKKEPASEQGTSLYQIGSGMFSANTTPPYHSWKQFRPIVEQGVECLLETRNDAEKQTPFAQVALRYINAFSDKFTESRSTARFIKEVLGFTIDLPPSVRTEMAQDAEPKVVLQFSIPLQSDRQMNLVLTEATVNGGHALVMDLSVLALTATAANKSDVMTVFDVSHEVIHRAFVGMTKKLSHIMQLVTGEGE